MGKYTKQDIVTMVAEEDVEFIRLQFVDIYGILKNVAVTASQLKRVLDNELTFDCGAIEGFENNNLSKLVFAPDIDTFAIFPWRPQSDRVGRFICDVKNVDGTPFANDSRYILKKVLKDAAKEGYYFNVGPECEFSCLTLTSRAIPQPTQVRKAHILMWDRLIRVRMQEGIWCFLYQIWGLR